MVSSLVLFACQPVTWSVDVTGIPYYGRATVAIKRAFQEWSTLTGLTFKWVPEGGVVSFVYRPIRRDWAAYTLADTVVVSPEVARYPARVQQSLMAHEIGHLLGIGHLPRDGSIVSEQGYQGSKVVTLEDAALVKIQPCD
jgi:hypothetical protein